MKKLLFLLALPLAAQTLTPTVSPSTVQPGQTATVTVTLSSSPSTALQYDSDFGIGVPAAPVKGAAAIGKNLFYNPPNRRTVLAGINAAAQGPIQPGVVATVVVTVPANAPAGPINIGLSNVLSSNAAGQPTPVIIGLAAVLNVVIPNIYDLNGDGVVNNADFGLVLDQVFGITPCSTADFGGGAGGAKDGKCDVADLVLVAKQI